MKIKILFLFTCLSVSLCSKAQDIEVIKKNLLQSFSRIGYWSDHSERDEHDSLSIANDNFEQLLLKYTASNPATITYNFKNLADSGLRIQSSSDGLFRIYSWDDMSGGTMRFFINVFQYKVGDKVYSKTLTPVNSKDEERDMGCVYTDLDEVVSNGKAYYVTQNIAVGSSALYAYTIKIFSIDNGQLNDQAKLIQTKSGLHNELNYSVDWSDASNRDNKLDRDAGNPVYDSKENIISIPLIQEGGKVTAKRIRYKFNGQYFVKMQ